MSTQPAQQAATRPATETQEVDAPIEVTKSDGSVSDQLAIASLLISLAAFVTAGATYRRGARIEKQNRFENAYGSNLRVQLRNLEKSLAELTAFVVYSGRSVEKLKSELGETRTQIELLCFDIAALLAEIDTAKIGGDGWRKPFRQQVQKAEEALDAATDDSVQHFKVLSGGARTARQSYEAAILHARTKLNELESKI